MTTTTYSVANKQWTRTYSLIVSGYSTGLDLSAFKFSFEIRADDYSAPNTGYFRVYNLRDTTIAAIKEFSNVSLSCGYQNGNSGVIFTGQVRQYKRGKESNVNSYLDIYAADSDEAYNFGFINQTFPPGTTLYQQLKALAGAMNVTVDPNVATTFANANVFPSATSKVAYGMARAELDTITSTVSARWSIQNGVLTVIPIAAYPTGTLVVVNSQSGMIGQPEATDQGIIVKLLINPLIKVGTGLQIDNGLINQNLTDGSGNQLTQYGVDQTVAAAPVIQARTADDGVYRVIVIEHFGDTRDNEWYSEIICLAADNNSVAPYGGGS